MPWYLYRRYNYSGTDDQDADEIKRLVGFLLKVEMEDGTYRRYNPRSPRGSKRKMLRPLRVFKDRTKE